MVITCVGFATFRNVGYKLKHSRRIYLRLVYLSALQQQAVRDKATAVWTVRY